MGDGFDIMLGMTSDHLRTILGHHVWATLLLLDRCATLTPDELRLTAPGTYGSIHATLGHLVAADRRYLVGITGGERAGMAAPCSWPWARYALGLSPTSSVNRELKEPSDVHPTSKHTSVTDTSPRRRSALARSIRRVMR
jgi:hypothetical protein